MNYTAELEALDRKWGRTVTVDDYRRLGEKSAATVTDDDLVIIENFGGQQSAAEARARRTLALNPVPPDPPATMTKQAAVEFPDHIWNVKAPDLVKEIDEWSDANEMKALPVGLWWTFVSLARKKREALAEKVAAVEQRVLALEGTTPTTAHATKPRVKFWGPWSTERLYQPDDAVNHDGTLLICRATHVSTAFDADAVCWQRP